MIPIKTWLLHHLIKRSYQTQVPQGRMQPSAEFPLGQWRGKLLKHGKKSKKKKKHGALKLTIEKQHELNKAPDMCRVVSTKVFHVPRRKLVLWQQKLANITL
jgi:hypothetical protein